MEQDLDKRVPPEAKTPMQRKRLESKSFQISTMFYDEGVWSREALGRERQLLKFHPHMHIRIRDQHLEKK